MRGNYYDKICLECDRYIGDALDHSPICSLSNLNAPIQPEPPWSRNQWDKVQQLQAEIEYYRRERADLLLKAANPKPDKKKRSKYD